jgi:hypothetical protein
MLATISTLGMTGVACGAFHQLLRGNSGVSTESHLLKTAAELVVRGRASESMNGPKNFLGSRLWELVVECGEPNWNGFEAAPIQVEAVKLAEEFIQAWPFAKDLPDCAPEPDGSVSLEWIYANNRRVAVSFNGGRRLAYAWMDGTEKGRGVCNFQGSQIPRAILDVVQQMKER